MHSNLHFIKTFTLAVLSLLLTKPLYADIDEIYHLSIGANIENYNTDLSINSIDASKNLGISLEDDLGYDSQNNTAWISGWYRVGKLHRIKLTYTPLNRSSSITNSKDIILDNTTIKAGATIKAETRAEIIDFSYIYSFHKTRALEMSLSGGIYWLLNHTKILAAGEIQAEGDDQPAFKSDYFTEQKIQAPMPLIGVSANYEISESWRTHAALRYLSVQIDEIDGSIFSAEAGLEYYFNDNWGLGTSLAYFDLDVKLQGIISHSTLSWDHSGIQVYAIFKY